MKFRALEGTADGRITEGKVYHGNVVAVSVHLQEHYGTRLRGQQVRSELRVAVFDNRNQWMTFNPKVFRPEEITNTEQEQKG